MARDVVSVSDTNLDDILIQILRRDLVPNLIVASLCDEKRAHPVKPLRSRQLVCPRFQPAESDVESLSASIPEAMVILVAVFMHEQGTAPIRQGHQATRRNDDLRVLT